MKPIYSDDQYASSRLRNSVVMRNGKPFFIRDVARGCTVIGVSLTGSPRDLERTEEEVFSFDNGFSLDTVPLGFYNKGGQCSYLSRIPSRRWRQGLVSDAIKGGMISTRTFFSKDFHNMVTGNYPSFKECLGDVRLNRAESKAFNRKFAITMSHGRLVLLYKKLAIGEAFTDGTYELNSKYMYLERRLRRAIRES